MAGVVAAAVVVAAAAVVVVAAAAVVACLLMIKCVDWGNPRRDAAVATSSERKILALGNLPNHKCRGRKPKIFLGLFRTF